MKELIVKAYTFDELSEKAKNKAREWMRSCREQETFWADQVADDARNVGIRLEEWDTEGPGTCSISFDDDAAGTAFAILHEHGASCDTHTLAVAFLEARDAAANAVPAGYQDARDEAVDRCDEQFERDIATAYLQMLKEAYIYTMSDEAIDEGIAASEYLFTEDGSRSVVLNG